MPFFSFFDWYPPGLDPAFTQVDLNDVIARVTTSDNCVGAIGSDDHEIKEVTAQGLSIYQDPER